MGLLDSVSEGLSNAYNEVTEAASDVADVVSDAADTVADAAGEVVDTVVDAGTSAAAWGEHVADQGAQWIRDKIEGEAPTDNVEGGANMRASNSGDPNERVDLSPDKVGDFLKTFGQKDKLDETTSDRARCQSNVIVAGLLLKGGPEGLKGGLEKGLAKAEQDLKSLPDGEPGSSEAAKKDALKNAVSEYKRTIAAIDSGEVTRGDLDRAGDALWHTFTTKDNYSVGKDDQGRWRTDGLAGSTVNEMERLVGLTTQQAPEEVGEQSAWNPANWFQDDNAEVSDEVWGRIGSGQTAHVGVNLYGEHIATGKGPNGEAVQYDGDRPYFVTGSGKKEYLEEDVNHAVLFGRNAEGQRFIYNPIGEPPYLVEKPGDQASTKALDEMSAKLMANRKSGGGGDYRAKVTRFD